MIAICDLGLENPKRLQRMLEHLGHMAIITSDHAEISCCDAVVITGYDLFPEGFNSLKKNKLDRVIQTMAKKDKQIIGIGVGAHLLCRSYDSGGLYKGMGLIPFDAYSQSPVEGFLPTTLDKELFGRDSAVLYYSQTGFVKKSPAHATAVYNGEFVSAYINKNVAALWFYPQKSGNSGIEALARVLDALEVGK